MEATPNICTLTMPISSSIATISFCTTSPSLFDGKHYKQGPPNPSVLNCLLTVMSLFALQSPEQTVGAVKILDYINNCFDCMGQFVCHWHADLWLVPL